MDRCEPTAVLDGMVSVFGFGSWVVVMNEYEYGWEQHESDVDDLVRSRFWLGYMLGLLTMFAVVGCMYV